MADEQHWSRKFVDDCIRQLVGEENVYRSKHAPPGWCTVKPLLFWHLRKEFETGTFEDIGDRLKAGTLTKKNAKKELATIFMEYHDAAA